MPEPDFLPEGLWGDEYRAAGGINVADYMAQIRAAQESSAGSYEPPPEPEAPAAPTFNEADFMDWQGYQSIVGDKLKPHEAYDEYVTVALPWQLKQMGYSDNEIAAEVQQFGRYVQSPAADYGVVGNLIHSATSGFRSGTRALRAAGDDVTGDVDAVAKLATEQALDAPNAKRIEFDQARRSANNDSVYESVKSFLGGIVDAPVGFANESVYQITQSFPVIGSALTALLVPAPGAGPAAAAASSFALDTGATLLGDIVDMAQQRGVDINDPAALKAMLAEPGVYQGLREGAAAHGFGVASVDAVLSSLTLGVGKAAGGLLRAGKPLRAGGLALGGVGVGMVGEGVGETVGTALQRKPFSPDDVVAEALSGIGPSLAFEGAGFARDLRNHQQPAVPGAPAVLEPEIEEGDLPGNQPAGPIPTLTGGVVPNANPTLAVGPEGGAFVPTPENIAARDRALAQPPSAAGIEVSEPTVEEINIGDVPGARPDIEVSELPVEEITLKPATFVDSAEARIAEGRLLTLQAGPPLAQGPEGVGPLGQIQQQRDNLRIQDATTPQAIDLNVQNPESTAQWLEDRGVTLTPAQHAIVEDLAGTPPRQRRSYIASVIDELVASPDANAEELAHGLLAIANSLPKDPSPKPAEAVAALARDLGVPPNQILPTVTSALAQQVMTDISAGVTNATEAKPTGQVDALGEPDAFPTPLTHAKRGLGRGEPIPGGGGLSSLINQLAGPEAPGRAQEPAQQPRGGLRAGVRQEGTGQRRNPLRRGEAAPVSGSAASAGTVAVNPPSAPGVSRVKKGLSRKAKIDVVVMDKAEYESTYPGRDYDTDLQGIVGTLDADKLGDTGNTHKVPNDKLLAMQNMSANEVLSWIASVAPNPLMRAVASELATLNLPTVFRLRRLKGISVGHYSYTEYAGGAFQDVVITDPYKQNGGTLESILHEYVHAATLHAYNNPRTPAQRAAAKQMDALFEYARNRGVFTEKDFYGLTNTSEFIAEALSNPEFQALLNNMTMPDAPKVSVWTAFKHLVLKLMGNLVKPDSVLAHTLASVEDLFKGAQGDTFRNVEANKDPTAPRRAPSSAMLGTKDGVRTFIAYAKKGSDDSFTLYPTTAQAMGGVKGSGIPGLSRKQVEEYIRTKGSEAIAPATDTTVATGTPKNTSKKLVGYANDGELQGLAFEQKDGSWTYYESDVDVRTDPDARISKGLSKDQVQRYITNRGLAPSPPTTGAVKPASATPTAVGYSPASNFQYQWQDNRGAIKKIGEAQSKAEHAPSENVGITANLRNSRGQNAYRIARRTYVDPVKQAGKQIMEQFGKTQAQVETTMQNMHIVERMKKKIDQTLRGKDDAVTQKKRIDGYQKKMDAANTAVANERNANLKYVQAVQQEFAPKWKALTDEITDTAARYGRYSKEVAEQIKAAYDYYVPLQTGERTTTGKYATGANVETDQSFARVVEMLHRVIGQGEDNRVTKSVADLIRKQGVVNSENGQPIGTVGTGTKVTYDADTNSLSETQDSHTFDDNTVFFYENGERVALTVDDPVLVKALAPFKKVDKGDAIAALMGISSWLNRLVAVGKTSLNLAFPIGNIQRDIQAANINLPNGVSRLRFHLQLTNPLTASEVTKNVMLELAGQDPTGMYAQAKQDGAFISHRDYVNLRAISNDLDSIFKPMSTWKGRNALRKHAQTKTFEALSLVAQISESVPRFAMYKAAYDSYMEGRDATDANRKEARIFAANAAKTSSVNFEQRGAKNLSSWWIFGNAKIQGLAALKQSGARMGATKATVGLLGITALGYLIANAQQDGEKDKDGKPKSVKVSDQQKDNRVFLNEGGFAMSLSQEISPFYIIGHALSELAHGNTSAAHTVSRIFTGIVNNVFPGNVPQSDVVGTKAEPLNFLIQSVVPSTLVPFAQAANNTNAFGNKIISGKDDKLKKGLPLSEMGSPTENQLAVNVAKGLYSATNGMIDVAPQQLKLFHNYFDPMTEPYAFVRDMAGGREAKYAGDIVNPVQRRLTANATSFYDQEQFDDLLAKATRAKYLAEQRGIATLSQEDQVLARAAATLAKVNSDANNLFKGSKLLTKERRDLLNERKRELLLGGIRRYNEMRDRTITKR